jgi:hypothetical protein
MLSTALLALMLTSSLISIDASARNKWIEIDTGFQIIEVLKPVDPVFINDGNDTIVIDAGDSWFLNYDLKLNKKYHVFLVGDFVINDTNPVTDYDVYTYLPNGNKYTTHTESAGLPEQIANDPAHQYFVPPQSGEYSFEIRHDERDSENESEPLPAIFMLIEHIDVNDWYSQKLEGRDYQDLELLDTAWGFEFNTTSPQIRVSVDVPSSVDMYEARLYAMANPDSEYQGYDLYDIGAPFGTYFTDFSGDYGGYNTSSRGDRNILAMDSGEFKGDPLEFTYDSPGEESGNNIFYYLVLIAEYGEGTVDFIIQTDFSPPELTLVDPPVLVIEDDDTEILVTIEDEADIEEVWVMYTNDGENWFREDLRSGVDGYEATLENYWAGDFVEYIVYARDEFDNVGSTESGFQVKKSVTISCSIADMTLMGDQNAKITGVTNLVLAPINATFTNGDYVKAFEIVTGEDGAFILTYKPSVLGDWSFQASFGGDNISQPTVSNVLTFLASSQRTQISASLSDTIVKKDQPLTVSGIVEPIGQGMQVDITLVSASASVSEKVSVANDGTYFFTFSPSETGIWNALSSYGDGFTYERSQSNILEFEVIPLTFFDKIMAIYLTMIRPPFIYGAVGLVGLCISSVAYVKRETIIKSLPGKLGKSVKKSSKQKKKKNGKNGDRFRRTKK